jgi:hypothetical protein
VLEMAMGKRVRGCLVLSGLFCKSQGSGGGGDLVREGDGGGLGSLCFFFLPREGAAAERGTSLGLGFFYFCFPSQNFSPPPPFKFYCRLIYIELFFSFLFFLKF